MDAPVIYLKVFVYNYSLVTLHIPVPYIYGTCEHFFCFE